MRNRIVFLCTGNICRSPLAEAVAAQKFEGLGLSFSSAGVSAVEGLPASRASVQYVADHMASLVGHRSQPVTAALMADTAWVIGMTRSHAAIFRSRYGRHFQGAVGILGLPGFDLARDRHSPEAEEVNDPYGMAYEHYAACGDQISRLLDGWQMTFTQLHGALAGDSGQEDQS